MRILKGYPGGGLGQLGIEFSGAANHPLGQSGGQSLRIFNGPAKRFPSGRGVAAIDQRFRKPRRNPGLDLGLGCVMNNLEPVVNRRLPIAPAQFLGHPGQDDVNGFAGPALLAGESPPRPGHLVVLGLLGRSIGKRAPGRVELALGHRPRRQSQDRVGRRAGGVRATSKPILQAQQGHRRCAQHTHSEPGGVGQQGKSLHAIEPDLTHDDVFGKKPEREQDPAGQNQAPAPTPQAIRGQECSEQTTGSAERNSALPGPRGVNQRGREECQSAESNKDERSPGPLESDAGD